MGLTARLGAVMVAVVVGAWALFHFAWIPHRCNAVSTAADRGTTAAEQTANDYERLVRARRNLQLLAGLRTSCPTDVRVPMLGAANELLVGRPEDALRTYRDALRIDQRLEIYVAMAETQIRLGRIDEGVASYVTAARFDPSRVETIFSEEVRRRVEEQLRASR